MTGNEPLRDLYRDVTVILPVFNEAGTIKEICELLAKRGARIIVVDDGSTDGSGIIAEHYGANVTFCAIRKGKGAALRRGIQEALRSGCTLVAMMDADGQHSVDDLDRLIERARSENTDLVIGERDFTTGMPRVRKWTNTVMSKILEWITGYHVRDSQCGLKVIRRASLERFALISSHFEIDSEILIEAARRQMKIAAVPIRTIYIPGRKSRIQPAIDTLRWLCFLHGETRASSELISSRYLQSSEN